MMRRDPGPKPPVPPNKPMLHKKPTDDVSVKFTDSLIEQKKKQVRVLNTLFLKAKANILGLQDQNNA